MAKLGFQWAALLFLGVLLGCGGDDGPEIATVTGTVKLDGNPLPDALVQFIPVDGAGGRPAGGKTDSEGKYTLNFAGDKKGAIPGKNMVRITTGSAAGEDDDGNATPAVPEKVPMKYNVKSELTFDVKPGEENVADFNLESKGPIQKIEEE